MQSFVILIALVSSVTASDNVPDAACLKRICEAVSGCNRYEQCKTSLLGGRREWRYCGLYQISRTYWGMAGNKGTKQRYLSCALNKSCSERTIRNFMRRQGADCDRNGVIDCNDFLRIHRFGCSSRTP